MAKPTRFECMLTHVSKYGIVLPNYSNNDEDTERDFFWKVAKENQHILKIKPWSKHALNLRRPDLFLKTLSQREKFFKSIDFPAPVFSIELRDGASLIAPIEDHNKNLLINCILFVSAKHSGRQHDVTITYGKLSRFSYASCKTTEKHVTVIHELKTVDSEAVTFNNLGLVQIFHEYLKHAEHQGESCRASLLPITHTLIANQLSATKTLS